MFQHQVDRGGEAARWVIITEVGGVSYLSHLNRGTGADVPVFTGDLSRAARFRSLGGLMEVLALLPSRLEAYEEDPRMLDYRGPQLEVL